MPWIFGIEFVLSSALRQQQFLSLQEMQKNLVTSLKSLRESRLNRIFHYLNFSLVICWFFPFFISALVYLLIGYCPSKSECQPVLTEGSSRLSLMLTLTHVLSNENSENVILVCHFMFVVKFQKLVGGRDRWQARCRGCVKYTETGRVYSMFCPQAGPGVSGEEWGEWTPLCVSSEYHLAF